MGSTSKRIVIVGGVAGGASAAARARRMDESAEIILFERDDHVSFANCGLPYYIGEEITDRDKLLVATPEHLAKRFRVDVRVRQEVVRIDRQQQLVQVLRKDDGSEYPEPYDKLILATGAGPIVPPIDGVGASNVFTLRNLADTDRIKTFVDAGHVGHAVVVGAGFIGLEMVEQLVRRGVATTLAELQPQVLPALDTEMAQLLAEELSRQGVTLRVGSGLARICTNADGRASAVELDDGTRIEADLVLLGLGVRPNVQLAEQAGLALGASRGVATNDFMQTSDPNIYAVGDAAEYAFAPTGTRMRVALAGPANRAGRLAGEHATRGQSAPMSPVLGTSIVRVFDVTAAITGLSHKATRRADQDVRSVTIIGKHHAGYFPGARTLTLKLLYEPDSGRVLGAQAVGGAGVDKRIDVIATAMHFGATVRDLAGVDLAYAPPFGAAKDPVHLAAFAACNQLDGLEEFCDCDANLDGQQIVDVRTQSEVERMPLGHVDKVIHIPVDELRDRLDELDPSLPTVVSCAVGLRGHVAARILAQHGFRVQNLAGGATMRNLAIAKA